MLQILFGKLREHELELGRLKEEEEEERKHNVALKTIVKTAGKTSTTRGKKKWIIKMRNTLSVKC